MKGFAALGVVAATAGAAEASISGLSRVSKMTILGPAVIKQEIPLVEFLDDRIGAVMFYKNSEADVLELEIYNFTHIPSDLCSSKRFEAPNNGKSYAVLVQTPDDCDTELDTLTEELQNKGAAAVLFESKECLCGVDDPKSNFCVSRPCVKNLTPKSAAESSELFIPAFVLARHHSERVIHCMHGNGEVNNATIKSKCEGSDRPRFAFRWSIPARHDSIIKLFTTSSETISPFKDRGFIENVATAFSDAVDGKFSIYPQVLDGTKLYTTCDDGEANCEEKDTINCTGADKSSDTCKNDCTHEGRYCHDPYDDLEASGIQILEENLRQVCALESGPLEHWFRYINLIKEDCLEKKKLTLECSIEVHGIAGLEYSKTAACVQKSNTEIAPKNSIMEKYKTTTVSFAKNYILKLPNLALNNYAVPYGNELGNVLNAVCAALSSPPSYCDCLAKNTFQPKLKIDILDDCFNADNESYLNAVAISVGAGLGVLLTVLFVCFVAYKSSCFRALHHDGARIEDSVEMTDITLGDSRGKPQVNHQASLVGTNDTTNSRAYLVQT